MKNVKTSDGGHGYGTPYGVNIAILRTGGRWFRAARQVKSPINSGPGIAGLRTAIDEKDFKGKKVEGNIEP